MIEDGQILFDRMSDPLVVMELIVCKCNRMWILKIVAMIQGMNMREIKAMTTMHEIKEINILYTQSVLADCLNH